MLLEMAADGMGDRVAVGRAKDGTTYAGLLEDARRLAAVLQASGAERLVLVDVNSDDIPTLLFGAALAGIPFVPLNYRLADDQLAALLARSAPALAVVEAGVPGRVGDIEGIEYVGAADLRARLARAEPVAGDSADPDGIAVLLFTSGT